jgi:hypothetical protein
VTSSNEGLATHWVDECILRCRHRNSEHLAINLYSNWENMGQEITVTAIAILRVPVDTDEFEPRLLAGIKRTLS